MADGKVIAVHLILIRCTLHAARCTLHAARCTLHRQLQ
jgi:hypothetical protein